jgi:conjugative transfer signal peptidase TraF
MMASLQGVDWSDASAARVEAPGRSADAGHPRPWRRVREVSPARTVLSLLVLCAFTTALACLAASHLIWNRTASLPLGLYVRSPGVRVNEGVLVALRVPPGVRGLVHERGYLPDGSLLIKPVAAVAGDHVCARRGVLFINGEPFGSILTRDSGNRELPVYRGCGVLPPGQVFLAARHPRSFDSRTFGPIDVHALQGTVTALWTY